MHDLNEITFITFVRIDNEERADNLRAMYNFYRNTCENYQHIFVEDDTECKVPSLLDVTPDDVCIFTKSTDEWRKCEGYNKAIKLAKTNILNLIDTDIIIRPEHLLETADLLKSNNNTALIYPFNGMFLCAEKPLKDRFCKELSYDTLYNELPNSLKRFESSHKHSREDLQRLLNSRHGDIHVGHLTSKGGCVMARRDNLVRCNGYNPNFVGWGFEDDEMPYRAGKLGFGVGMLPGPEKVCWHLHHFDGTGSKKETQVNYDRNKNIFESVMGMTDEETKKYTYTWRM